MNTFSKTTHNIFEEEKQMKDFMMLLGFSAGLITGALLYKYSTCTKEVVDKTEKAVMKEIDKIEDKVKK